MRTIGLYRMLYGADFIGESLASIYPHCEKILCFVSHQMFGGGQVIEYFGRDVYLPHDIEGLTDAIHAWKRANDADNKVRVVRNPFQTQHRNQVQRLVNELVLPEHPWCTHLLFVEPDEVWHEDAAGLFFDIARESDADEFQTEQELFWRSYRYSSLRDIAYAAMLAIKGRKAIGRTGLSLISPDRGMKRLVTGVRVHNFGYAASERTLFWKHLTSLRFGRDLKMDCPPREEWFEDVWRAWDWRTNRRTDLCPTLGHEQAFGTVREYPFEELPALMKKRVAERPLAEWAEETLGEVKPERVAAPAAA